jgi:FkbM family methyltransferase
MNILQTYLIRPYIWNELPAWGWVYQQFIGDYRQDPCWQGETPKIVRGKLHGYEMELDISRWSERLTYFLGRLYDLETQLVLMRVLHQGDRIVDIGANIGMLSILSSHLVGSDGVVDAFEPNPHCAHRIRSLIKRNQILNIRVHGLALGDSEGNLPLSVPKYNSGEGTLTSITGGEFGLPENVEVFEVPVRVGDQVLAADSRPPIFIKIDVEGFEHQVISGLRGMLNDHQPLVTTEMVASHLKRAKRTLRDLFDLMESNGYKAYTPKLERKKLQHVLSLELTNERKLPKDVLWVPDGGAARERLQLV